MRPLTISIVLVVMLAGCGTSDEKRVRTTIAADLRAHERADWNGACGLRAAAGRREFLRASLQPDANTWLIDAEPFS